MSSRRAALTAAVVVLATSTLTVAALFGNPPTATAASSTTTVTPVADTYVQSDTPSTSYGTAARLAVDASPIDRSFLKFSVSGLVDPVTSATLRIHTVDVSGASSPAGGSVASVGDTTWSETGVTYNAQPAVDGPVRGTLGSVARNTWYAVDVTAAVTGNGTFAFALTSANKNDALFDAREAGATAPQLVITTGATPTPTPVPTPGPTPPPGDPVLVGAGDISDCANTGDSATAALLDGIAGTVYTVGDNVYANGTATEFTNCYDPTWGRHKARTRPSPGNHDYGTANAAGYFGYFGSLAGPSGQGYYSYDLGSWHVVSLDSEIAHTAGSAQEQWLRADLAASSKPCTVAYWHKPLFTSGSNHAPDTTMAPLWQALYDFNADLVLSGHNHQYERFAPQNTAGALDTARGIREFVVGTGGESHYGFGTVQPNSEARNADTFGVLKLTLHASGYDWQFVPEAGRTYTDTGSGSCH